MVSVGNDSRSIRYGNAEINAVGIYRIKKFLDGKDPEDLYCAFSWSDTPEGYEFWEEFLEKGKHEEDAFAKLRKILDLWQNEGNTLFDPVEKPAHYNQGGVECIDYIRQVLGEEGFKAYCIGNTIKYVHRHQYKGKPLEDLKKAQYYLNKAISTLEKET